MLRLQFRIPQRVRVRQRHLRIYCESQEPASRLFSLRCARYPRASGPWPRRRPRCSGEYRSTGVEGSRRAGCRIGDNIPCLLELDTRGVIRAKMTMPRRPCPVVQRKCRVHWACERQSIPSMRLKPASAPWPRIVLRQLDVGDAHLALISTSADSGDCTCHASVQVARRTRSFSSGDLLAQGAPGGDGGLDGLGDPALGGVLGDGVQHVPGLGLGQLLGGLDAVPDQQ